MLRTIASKFLQSAIGLEKTRLSIPFERCCKIAGDDLGSSGWKPVVCELQKRWATKKAGGTVKNSSDSKPKYLGVKKFGGEWCKPGNIIIRQRGQKYKPGEYVGMGRDYTIWALVEGQVRFWKMVVRSPRTGRLKRKTCVGIVPGTKPPRNPKRLPSTRRKKRSLKRRELKRKLKPIKERNRLFLYELPQKLVLASPYEIRQPTLTSTATQSV